VILAGKRLLITGVITKDSIAFHVAEQAQREGASVVLTSFGRVRRLTERAAQRLPEPVDVLELDVNRDDDLSAVADSLRERWGGLDGVLHAIAFAPEDAIGGRFMTAPPESAVEAFRTSAYSLKALAGALAPLMAGGGSIVGMDFDASVAWPIYDWMGVAKAALESVSRYLARDLGPSGVRVNLVAAGPLGTIAAQSCGRRWLRWGGTSRTPHRSRPPCAGCCRTTPGASPARSCTWTAGSTRSGRRARSSPRRSTATDDRNGSSVEVGGEVGRG
jgi:enoyl-[acyl-carrier protein] reductase I